MSDSARVLAVDLGATSVRVAAVDLGAAEPAIEVLHRWQNGPIRVPDGTLRWDWPRLVAEVETGLEHGTATGPVASIGVDGWGVDYGLVGADGSLVTLPFSYRDGRTANWRTTAEAIGLDRLYDITGIQLMGINTIFQLAVHDRDELRRAGRLLLLPDLLVHDLTGFEGAERSNASTTGLLDARSGQWAIDVLEALALPPALFPDVVAAGQPAGSWRDIPVTVVGSHDTASAFLGMPGRSSAGTVFVSTGTWVIVGIERPAVDTSGAARRANFSNEAGALGGFRFVKNVVGFWVLEQCRSAWGDPPLEVLVDEAMAVAERVPIFDARDERFVAPADMDREVRAATGLSPNASRGVIVRVVLESIAAGVAAVIEELARITSTRLRQVALVGGGARIALLRDALEAHTGLAVVQGSPEATALGNALVQGIALGRFDDIAAASPWLETAGERR